MLESGEITRDYGFEQRKASIEKNCGKFKIIMHDNNRLIMLDNSRLNFMRVNYFNSVEFKTVLPVALN